MPEVARVVWRRGRVVARKPDVGRQARIEGCAREPTTMPKYCQMVMGPAGCGKSTYCSSMNAYMEEAHSYRRVHIVNLDPAAEHFDYPVVWDIRDVISVDDVAEALHFGPNGGLIYCMEFLLNNLDVGATPGFSPHHLCSASNPHVSPEPPPKKKMEYPVSDGYRLTRLLPFSRAKPLARANRCSTRCWASTKTIT